MTTKRGGLGRNLSALLSTSPNTVLSPSKPVAEGMQLAITSLQPGKYQPRADIEQGPLNELAASIKQQGLLQPLIVRQLGQDDRYEIIAGERRWRACQLAGLTEIPVILRQVDDETAMAMALVENLQREDLNAMDQARAMYRLTTEFALTHQQVADLLCKSRTAVSNYLRLLNLSADVKKLLEHGDLDMGHARALLMLDEIQQNDVAKLIVSKNLSVRETEKLVERIKSGKRLEENNETINPLINDQVQTLALHLRTKIKVKQGKAGKGTLVIHYSDVQSLQNFIHQLSK